MLSPPQAPLNTIRINRGGDHTQHPTNHRSANPYKAPVGVGVGIGHWYFRGLVSYPTQATLTHNLCRYRYRYIYSHLYVRPTALT